VQQSVEKTAIFLTALGLGVLIEDDFMERETGASRDMTGWFLFHFLPWGFHFYIVLFTLMYIEQFLIWIYTKKTINLYRRRVNWCRKDSLCVEKNIYFIYIPFLCLYFFTKFVKVFVTFCLFHLSIPFGSISFFVFHCIFVNKIRFLISHAFFQFLELRQLPLIRFRFR